MLHRGGGGGHLPILCCGWGLSGEQGGASAQRGRYGGDNHRSIPLLYMVRFLAPLSFIRLCIPAGLADDDHPAAAPKQQQAASRSSKGAGSGTGTGSGATDWMKQLERTMENFDLQQSGGGRRNGGGGDRDYDEAPRRGGGGGSSGGPAMVSIVGYEPLGPSSGGGGGSSSSRGGASSSATYGGGSGLGYGQIAGERMGEGGARRWADCSRR